MLELQFCAKHLSQIRNAIFHVTLFVFIPRKFAIVWQGLKATQSLASRSLASESLATQSLASQLIDRPIAQ